MSHAAVLVALNGATSLSHVDSAVYYQMEPFNENGEWFRDGSRWDWWEIGGRFSDLLPADIMRRDQVDLQGIRQHSAEMIYEDWQRGQKEENAELRKAIYGIEPGDTFEQYLERNQTSFPPFFAFLRNRVWHERARMGWFGGTAQTECELAGEDSQKCLHTDEHTGAKIISWGNDQTWGVKFFDRFVRDLPGSTILVVVDYHI